MPLPVSAKILIGAVSLAGVVTAIVYHKQILEWLQAKRSGMANLTSAILDSSISPQVVDQLTYEEAFSYFVDDRPEDPRVVKGAMLLEDDAKGQRLTQIFLDEDNNLVSGPNSKPYGRRLVVRNLDAELQETFGGNNLVIVE